MYRADFLFGQFVMMSFICTSSRDAERQKGEQSDDSTHYATPIGISSQARNPSAFYTYRSGVVRRLSLDNRNSWMAIQLWLRDCRADFRCVSIVSRRLCAGSRCHPRSGFYI